MEMFEVVPFFLITALAEIMGCYLPLLLLHQGRPIWLLIPAAFTLVVIVRLLSLHPVASGGGCQAT
jgi:small multidrug resistance family-3 protein